MRSTFKILFYLNTSKRKKSSLCPVMGRITVDGNVAQFSLKEDAHPAQWNTQKGRARGKSRELIELNQKIEQTEQSIRNIYKRTVDTTGFITAEQIKNELTGTVTKPEYLLELFKEHNREYEKRVGIDRRQSTFYTYENSYNHLSRFILLKYKAKDFPLKQLDMTFIDDYDYYMRVDAGLNSNSMVKHIILLKKMVTRAMNQRTILCDPFPDYEKNKLKYKYQHLSKVELEKIMSTRIKSKSVCFVRDMFVFSCFTGLAYADMRELSDKHIRKMPDGNKWIEIPRYKTEVISRIRLLDIPLLIIEKYHSERKGEQLFQMTSNGSISRNMRNIEKLCDIEHLHFHMARHTFATLICLSNDVSFEGLSKMMGHNSVRSSQIYGEITNQKVREDMKKLAKRTIKKSRKKLKIEN